MVSSRHVSHAGVLVLAGALFCAARRADASWPSSPLENVPICTAADLQSSPVVTTDSKGGAIIIWNDRRSGLDVDVYAQHVQANGVVDPSWPVGGIALCTAVGDQFNVRAVADGAGGAIAVWQDARTGTSDIYVQHVLASGTIDPNWPVNGVAVCSANGSQTSPVVASDGAGGVIVSWLDSRAGGISDVYAQRVLASGVVDAAWQVDGRPLCLAAGNQQRLATTPDGQGGAVVAWQDFRSGATSDIYCSRVQSNGLVAPTWPNDGLIVCDAAGSQLIPDVAGNTQGGVLVTWQDLRGGSTSDIYAQRVLGSGSVDPAWPSNGALVCSAGLNQSIARLVSDGAGGAIVAWLDDRSATTGTDIYAQHLRSDGVVDPVWPLDGVALCTAFGVQSNQTIAQDGTGGAIVCWQDARTGQSSSDVYALHVLNSGATDQQWPSNGRAISTAANQQQAPAALADGSGGIIVAWTDFRGASGATSDIYAQRLQADGQLGGTVVGVEFDQHGALALDELHPNPWGGGVLTVRYTLTNDEAATLDVLDTTGRRLTSRSLAPLRGVVRIEAHEFTSNPAPGVYFARISQGRFERVRRFVVLE